MRRFLSSAPVISAIAVAIGVLFANASPLVAQTTKSSIAKTKCKPGCNRYSYPAIYHNSPAPVWPGYRIGSRVSDPVYAGHRYGGQQGYQPVPGGGYVSANPPMIYQPHRRTYRKARKRYHPRHYRHGQETGYLPSYPGRTQYCRETVERRGYGWHKKKVRVRRCVLVRNDLLGRYRSDW